MANQEQENPEQQRQRRRLKEAGITVVNLSAKLQSSDVDSETLQEVTRNINLHLYKAKDRKTLERLEAPAIEEGIFVLHTGEYCAATDVGYWKLRRSRPEA